MILNEIAISTKERYAEIMAKVPLSLVKNQALSMPKGDFLFEQALKSPGVSLICEIKKASPSKGLIAKDFCPVEIAKEYEKGGAAAISCLTEPKYFLGNDKYLADIVNSVSIPVLRKDFTLYDYQIYEAKILGASAVLLICALLDTNTIKRYITICDSLGISALVEAHNPEEISSAISAGARIIGVNNRNLKDFSVDISLSTKYRQMIDSNIIFVSESGITSKSQIDILKKNKTDAALIGEFLMRSTDKAGKIEELLYG